MKELIDQLAAFEKELDSNSRVTKEKFEWERQPANVDSIVIQTILR
jgi:hypothetical protein